MTYDRKTDTLLTLREAANHIKDGAKIYARVILVHGEKPQVVGIEPTLLRAHLERDPEPECESPFCVDAEGDLWLVAEMTF